MLVSHKDEVIIKGIAQVLLSKEHLNFTMLRNILSEFGYDLNPKVSNCKVAVPPNGKFKGFIANLPKEVKSDAQIIKFLQDNRVPEAESLNWFVY
jgi:hypothetical protein